MSVSSVGTDDDEFGGMQASSASLQPGRDASAARSDASKGKRSLRSIFGLSTVGGPLTIWTAKSHYADDTRIYFKKRIIQVFNEFTSLKTFVELNYSGFTKILKKCVRNRAIGLS